MGLGFHSVLCLGLCLCRVYIMSYSLWQHIGSGTLEEAMAGAIKTILLRADMDALPIHEETDVPFKS